MTEPLRPNVCVDGFLLARPLHTPHTVAATPRSADLQGHPHSTR